MLIEIRRGLEVPVSGQPEQIIYPVSEPHRAAVIGLDYPGIRPSLRVAEGDSVTRGQTLFTDRIDPSICFTSPACGRVRDINRGPKRSVVSIVIEREGDSVQRFAHYADSALRCLNHDEIRSVLLASGLWTTFRVRPYRSVPRADRRPAEIFVSAIDTSPLAPDPRVVIGEAADDFARGLIVLSGLATDKVYVCTGPGADPATPDVAKLVTVQFSGSHPAGLPGTHVYHLSGADTDRADRWHVEYQDVIAIGHLFSHGEMPDERVIAIAGSGAHKPRLLRVRPGAGLDTVLAGEVQGGVRVISGSVLTGRITNPATHYVSAVHSQVSILGGSAESFGATGMLSVEAFERVWPFAAPPIALLRALLIKDTQTAIALGCLELDVEDLALCSYVCPARLDYGRALLETLAAIDKLGSL